MKGDEVAAPLIASDPVYSQVVVLSVVIAVGVAVMLALVTHR